MKYLFIIFLLLISKISLCQTLTYYSYRSDKDWSCITLFNNSVGSDKMILFNSSRVNQPQVIKILTNQASGNINAMTVNIGDDKTPYILVQDKTNQTWVMTDSHQLFRNDFVLDSKIYAPAVSKTLDSGQLTSLLSLFKLLL